MQEADINYEWVKSHQDAKRACRCLSLEEQLNTMCDTMLANGAVNRGLIQGQTLVGPTLLPFEWVVVLVNGVKITSQIAPAIRFALGHVEAKRFYTKAVERRHGSNKGGLGWQEESFEEVDWETLAKALKCKPVGFQLWLSKQAI